MTPWKNIISVRGPLITAISLILIAGFLTTNLISYQVSKHSLRQALIDNELPLTSNNIYSEIQRDLLKPVFVSSLMANDTFVNDWLKSGEVDSTQMTRYLSTIKDKYDVFTSFLVSDATHRYYHFTGISQEVSEADDRDAWYFRFRDIAEAHELNVDYNAEQGDTLTIFINHKIFDTDGTYLATTGVGLDFSTVATIVDRYKEHFGRHVYFVDDSGDIMLRSQGSMIVEDNISTAPGIKTIASKLMAQDHGFYEYERDGETMLVNARNIPELKWRVIVEQRESDALSSIRESLLTNTVVGLGVIALTLFLVSYTVGIFHTRLEAMASTDKLTGIGNRSMFDLNLINALKLFQRNSQPFSVILLDIDHFKRVNDTLGHMEGDRVLREISNLLQDAVRDSDVLCRWGGEELIILVHDCAIDSALVLAEKIRSVIESTTLASLADGSPITISAGVTEALSDDSVDTILGRADEALYTAKQGGRNCVRSA